MVAEYPADVRMALQVFNASRQLRLQLPGCIVRPDLCNPVHYRPVGRFMRMS